MRNLKLKIQIYFGHEAYIYSLRAIQQSSTLFRFSSLCYDVMIDETQKETKI